MDQKVINKLFENIWKPEYKDLDIWDHIESLCHTYFCKGYEKGFEDGQEQAKTDFFAGRQAYEESE